MTSTPTRYVHVFRRWDSRGQRWTTQCGVAREDDGTPTRSPDTIGIFAVDNCPTRLEAPGVVIEWLLRDRPRTMTVRLLGGES